MEIIKGKIMSAQKTVVYGPEGIGKSTFAAQFPDPLFIDTEGSTKHMDVARLPKPSSFAMLLEEIKYVQSNPAVCKTLVVDTIDWAEQLCISDICSRYQKKGIEDFGYGNGYVYTKEEFGRFLNQLDEIIERGINVTLTAHAQMRKFEQPDEMGAYDRYELKLGKKTSSQTSPLVKEWADTVLFVNYKTFAVASDDKGKKFKAQGGTRVMYTSHHPCWDAKNRWGLNPEVPFDFAEIAPFIPTFGATNNNSISGQTKSHNDEEKPVQTENYNPQPEQKEQPKQQETVVDDGMPKALKDLMSENSVTYDEIQFVVTQRGYYPSGTPVENYDPEFISGVLIGAWAQVFAMIEENRKKENIPF